MNSRKLNRAIKETKAFKEQTPITALQTILSKTNAPEFTDSRDELCESYLFIADAMEQYANAKVLEALEKEIPKAFYKGANQHRINCIPIYETEVEEIDRFNLESKYYETEVRPKYK